MKNIKYIIHPGPVQSINDGDWHNISSERLIKLYCLNPKECFTARTVSDIPRDINENPLYTHIWPLRNGNYPLYKRFKKKTGDENESL